MDYKTLYYVTESGNPGKIYLSAYECDSPEWETNHIMVDTLPRVREDKVSCSVEINVLTNVLSQAGIKLVCG